MTLHKILAAASISSLYTFAQAFCPSTGSCDCSWASEATCSSADEQSECFSTCCRCPSAQVDLPSRILQSNWAQGMTTRYWDCCKPSCAWPGKAKVKTTMKVCDAQGMVLLDNNVPNACVAGGGPGGPAYVCNDQQPFFDEDTSTSYLFAAASLLGQGEADFCCACYQMDFNTATHAGKVIVQVTNTGADLGSNHFDLQIPGGGFGIYDACTGSQSSFPAQYPQSVTQAWGMKYGGLLAAGAQNVTACENLPPELYRGCAWFFKQFQAQNNPGMRFGRVQCPKKLVAVSGCQREDDHLYPFEVGQPAPPPPPPAGPPSPPPPPPPSPSSPSLPSVAQGCTFPAPPSEHTTWDLTCVTIGGAGCFADGVHPECRYCGGTGAFASIPCDHDAEIPAPAPEPSQPTESTTPAPSSTPDPTGCQFANPPTEKYTWDPSCTSTPGAGCMADGLHPECRFCGGSGPFAAIPCEEAFLIVP